MQFSFRGFKIYDGEVDENGFKIFGRCNIETQFFEIGRSGPSSSCRTMWAKYLKRNLVRTLSE